MAGFPTLKAHDLDLGTGCIPSCITHRPLPTCKISLKSKKLESLHLFIKLPRTERPFASVLQANTHISTQIGLHVTLCKHCH